MSPTATDDRSCRRPPANRSTSSPAATAWASGCASCPMLPEQCRCSSRTPTCGRSTSTAGGLRKKGDWAADWLFWAIVSGMVVARLILLWWGVRHPGRPPGPADTGRQRGQPAAAGDVHHADLAAGDLPVRHQREGLHLGDLLAGPVQRRPPVPGESAGAGRRQPGTRTTDRAGNSSHADSWPCGSPGCAFPHSWARW